MDAKTCTVVGAALYQDFRQQQGGFNVIIENRDEFQRNAYWGIIPTAGAPIRFFDGTHLIFNPNEYMGATSDPKHPDRLEKKSRPMRLDLAAAYWIGRQLVRDEQVQPAPVYRLSWDPPLGSYRPELAWADVVFRWVSIRGKGDMLELVSVTPVAGGPAINLRDVHLRLNTLMEEEGEYWLDNPRLAVTLGGMEAAAPPPRARI